MSHIYRCSRCRTRNTFKKALADYARPKHCRHCNHAHFYVDKERLNRKPCVCGGYHFVHRPGGGACVLSKTREYHIAKRGGNAAEIAEARMNCVVEHGAFTTRAKVNAEAPF